MTLHISKGWAAAIVAAVLAVGWFAYDAAVESCDEWHARYRAALSESIQYVPGFDTSSADRAVAVIAAARPEGC